MHAQPLTRQLSDSPGPEIIETYKIIRKTSCNGINIS